MTRVAIWVSSIILSAGLVSGHTVYGQDDLRNTVLERKMMMKSMLKSYFPLMAIQSGKSTDFQAAVEAAGTLRENMLASLPLFVEGTAKGEVPGSRAKPEIWSDFAEFEAAAKELIAATEDLAEAAGAADLEAFKPRFELLETACLACHDFKPTAGGRFRFAK